LESTKLKVVQNSEEALKAFEDLLFKKEQKEEKITNKSRNETPKEKSRQIIEKHSSLLLKDPLGKSHSSWHLCCPQHFNDAMDIKYIEKTQVKDKVVVDRWREWVQGTNFNFEEGSVLYDRDVSGYVTWGEKLSLIKFFVEVYKSTPVSIIEKIDPNNGKVVLVRDKGHIEFHIFEPTEDKKSCKVVEKIDINQDDFVRYAISGNY
tara:strand:- start:2675 stop:3292 length:618 start_codon:yes stop_codon:yes gene_type:complete